MGEAREGKRRGERGKIESEKESEKEASGMKGIQARRSKTVKRETQRGKEGRESRGETERRVRKGRECGLSSFLFSVQMPGDTERQGNMTADIWLPLIML